MIRFTPTGLAWVMAFRRAVGQAEAEFRAEVGEDVATVVADFNEGVQGLITATMCSQVTPVQQCIRGHNGSFVFGNGENFIFDMGPGSIANYLAAGVPLNRLNDIFEPFHQLDGSTTRHYGGTGLGLWLVRQIIEAHGSMIEVQSTEGRGSTFKFPLLVAGDPQ